MYNVRMVKTLNCEKFLAQASPTHFDDMQIINFYDGELVQDNIFVKDENNDIEIGLQLHPTFLVFDCLMVNAHNVMHLNFRERLKEAEKYILNNHTVFRLY